jgi:hypothetical protein
MSPDFKLYPIGSNIGLIENGRPDVGTVMDISFRSSRGRQLAFTSATLCILDVTLDPPNAWIIIQTMRSTFMAGLVIQPPVRSHVRRLRLSQQQAPQPGSLSQWQHAAIRQQGPVRLPGWCNYDHRPYFAGPPTPLKSSVELQNSACRVDTYHPLKTVGIRGFWPRYARLETTHPPKCGQRQPGTTPTHPHADSEICS